jgi:phage terminase small subunit
MNRFGFWLKARSLGSEAVWSSRIICSPIISTEEESKVEITEVRVTLRDEPKLKAFVNVTFDNAFVIRGLKVINGTKGYFVSMPSRKRNNRASDKQRDPAPDRGEGSGSLRGGIEEGWNRRRHRRVGRRADGVNHTVRAAEPVTSQRTRTSQRLRSRLLASPPVLNPGHGRESFF